MSSFRGSSFPDEYFNFLWKAAEYISVHTTVYYYTCKRQEIVLKQKIELRDIDIIKLSVFFKVHGTYTRHNYELPELAYAARIKESNIG
jgi:hypothetical protein